MLYFTVLQSRPCTLFTPYFYNLALYHLIIIAVCHFEKDCSLKQKTTSSYNITSLTLLAMSVERTGVVISQNSFFLSD